MELTVGEFIECIEKSRKAKAPPEMNNIYVRFLESELESVLKLPLEDLLVSTRHTARWATYYAMVVLGGRFKPAEPIIASSPRMAVQYAIGVIKGRWPEGEPTIAESAKWSYVYASSVIHDRFRRGEMSIKESPLYAYLYARYVIGGRWSAAERTLSQSAEWAYRYAKDVLKGRFPRGEPAIAASDRYQQDYKRMLDESMVKMIPKKDFLALVDAANRAKELLKAYTVLDVDRPTLHERDALCKDLDAALKAVDG